MIIKRILSATIVFAGLSIGAATPGPPIDSAIVVSKANPAGLAKRCARYYAGHYAKNWIGEATYWRTESSCGGHYDRLYAASGIWATFNFTQKSPKFYWDDKTIHCFRATDDCSTLPRIPGTTEVDKVISVPYNSREKGFDLYFKCYHHTHSQNIYANVRALELFSPLNIRHSDDFEYNLTDVRETPEGLVYEIGFKSIGSRFSRKTRIFLSGYFVMHENGTIERLACHNLINWYSDYIRAEVSSAAEVGNLAYSEIIIHFGMHEEALCVDRVVQTVTWQTEGIDSLRGKKLYAIESNTYRNPFKYGMESRTEITLTHHKILEHQDSIKALRKHFPSIADFSMSFMDEKRRTSEIEPVLKTIPEIEKVKQDIEDCGIDIYTQFAQSLEMYTMYAETTFQNPEESIKRIKSRYETARQLKDLLFSQD